MVVTGLGGGVLGVLPPLLGELVELDGSSLTDGANELLDILRCSLLFWLLLSKLNLDLSPEGVSDRGESPRRGTVKLEMVPTL